MKNLKQIIALFILATSVVHINAQNKKENSEGEVKVIMIKNDNGEVTKVDKSFSIDEKDKVQELLKEYGVEIDLDNLNYEGDIRVYDSENGEIRKVVVNNKKCHFTGENKTFSSEEKEKLETILKEHGIEIDINSLEGESRFNVDELIDQNVVVKMINEEKIDGKVVKEIKITKFKSEDIKSEFNDDLLIELKKAAEDGNVKKIMELTGGDDQKMTFINDEDVSIEYPSDGKKVIVKTYEYNTELDESTKMGTMIFLKRESVISSEDKLPTKIEESFDKGSSIQDLKLYPNPANYNFNMSFISKESQDYRLSITDSKGSKIFEKELMNFEGNFNEDFDLSKYTNGVYFFNLISDEETISKQIIVQ